MRWFLLATWVSFSWSATAQSSATPQIYWSEQAGVTRAQLDGSHVEPVSPGVSVGGVALDRPRHQLFYSEILPLGGPGPAGFVRRGTADGHGVVSIVDRLPAPTVMTIDIQEGQVIWADQETHGIYRARLDGSERQTLLEPSDSIVDIGGLAIDPWNRQLYFSFVNPLIDSLNPGSIAVMNLEPSKPIRHAVDGLVSPQGVAFDHIRKRVYWADENHEGTGYIGAAFWDGNDRVELAGDLIDPRGVAVDPFSNQVYWADSGSGKIQTHTPFVPAVDLVTERNAPRAIGLLISSGMIGDTNDDGQVDLADLNNVRNAFGNADGAYLGDADFDGDVDLEDLNGVRNHFGERFLPPDELAAVPEPSALALGLLALVGLNWLRISARKTPT
jgi:hypothetical protein